MSTVRDSAPDGSRDKFIAPKDVNRMARALDDEKIRLHPEDAISTKLWVDRLKADNALVFYKDKIGLPPPDLRLDQDLFILCIQTEFQLDAFRRLGNGFIGIDTMHNITQYQDLLLFMIIARDRWGHGESLFDTGLWCGALIVLNRRSDRLDA